MRTEQRNAHVDKHVKLRGINECDVRDSDVGAELHPKQIWPMVCVIDDDVSPPIIPSAVDQPRATHSDIVAIVELNCGLAAEAPVAAASPLELERSL